MKNRTKKLLFAGIVLAVAALIAAPYFIFLPKPSPTEVTPIEPLLLLPTGGCSAITDRSCDVKPPANAPPSTVRVGPLLMHIYFRQSKDMQGDWGMSNYEREIVLLDVTQPLETMRDTLWHELTHVAIRAGNKREGLDGATEDEFIEASVPTQLLILQENPRLRKW